LLAGKPLAILGVSFAACRLGLCSLPGGLSWSHLAGISLLAGIGFTVSLFIADLAFESNALLEQAKLGILIASFFAGIAGFGFLRSTSRKGVLPGAMR
jgi:NhaA family Na+:H+ antiporter